MSLAQNAYIDASNVYESSLENSYKKDNGVFYTDLPLAEKMLMELKLPKDTVIMDIKALRLIQFNYSSADFAA